MSFIVDKTQRFSTNAPKFNPYFALKCALYFDEGVEIVKKVTARSQKIWLHLDTQTVIFPNHAYAKKWDEIVQAELQLSAFFKLHKMFSLPVTLKLISVNPNDPKDKTYAYPSLSSLASENVFLLDPQNDRTSTWRIYRKKLGLSASQEPSAILEAALSELVTDLAKIVLFKLPLKNEDFCLVFDHGKVRFMGQNLIQKISDVPTKPHNPDIKVMQPLVKNVLRKIFEMILACELNEFAIDRPTAELFATEYTEKVLTEAKRLYDSKPLAQHS